MGNSTDGAANMQGSYQGFSAFLSQQSPSQIHVWCYAHVLNLVLSDATGSVIESASLFSLLNDIAVFLRESYKRMQVWEEVSKDSRHRRLIPIGETRWWAKDQALTKVFGTYGNPQDALYVDLLLTLESVLRDSTMKPTVRAKAKGFLDTLLKYELLLTAQTFLGVFHHTSPLSKYLQTQGIDILSAHRLVEGTQDSIKECLRDFEGVKCAADTFVQWANERLHEAECDLEVQAELSQKRARKKRRMPGELQEDEPVASSYAAFEVNVHNVILDTVSGSLEKRFAANGKLASDFACLDPKNFPQIKRDGLPSSSFQQISSCLIAFDESATVSSLQEELSSLATQWERLKKSPLESYTVRTGIEKALSGQEGDTNGGEPQIEIERSVCNSCRNCPVCVYLVLSQYNLFTDAYHVIGLAYKYLLTLSISQVACERTFSTLKFVKNRLRSTLHQEHLEAFMLMCTEKETLMALDSDAIIDKVAQTSALLRQQLMF